MPVVKPEIDQQVMPTETPMPEVQFDEPVVAPVENTAPSENAIAATTAGAVAQDLKTSNRVEPTYPPAIATRG